MTRGPRYEEYRRAYEKMRARDPTLAGVWLLLERSVRRVARELTKMGFEDDDKPPHSAVMEAEARIRMRGEWRESWDAARSYMERLTIEAASVDEIIQESVLQDAETKARSVPSPRRIRPETDATHVFGFGSDGDPRRQWALRDLWDAADDE